jgi:hypothetical protein
MTASEQPSKAPEPIGQQPNWMQALMDRAFRATVMGEPMAEGESDWAQALASRAFRTEVMRGVGEGEKATGE